MLLGSAARRRRAARRDRRSCPPARRSRVSRLAAGIGLADPPVGACLRTLLPGLLPDPDAVRGAYAVEAGAVELTWVVGPPIALGLGALWSTGAALARRRRVLLAATAAFAAPAGLARAGGPDDGGHAAARRLAAGTGDADARARPARRVGVLFGAVEVGVTAAADALGSAGAAGPLLALWGAGSLIGGLLAARLGGGARERAAGWRSCSRALAAGTSRSSPARAALVALGAVLLVAGAAIAPTYATRVRDGRRTPRPAGTVDRGVRVARHRRGRRRRRGGAAAGGAVADRAGPRPQRSRSPAPPGALAVLVTLLRATTLGLGAASDRVAYQPVG